MKVDGVEHTTSPIVTGSSIVAMRCADGVVLGSDTLASYGSLARFKEMPRLYKATDACVIGASGEYSDFQEVQTVIDELVTEDYCADDGVFTTPNELYHYLSRVMYNRRNKMNPLYNSLVIAGSHNGTQTLGLVDLYGTHFESEVIATGYGLYMALPLLRKAYRPDITVAEAKPIIEQIMTVLYYRDARTIDTIQIAEATQEGVKISEPFKVKAEWEYKRFIAGARAADASTW